MPAARVYCYESKVPGEEMILSCHQTLADCKKAHKTEDEHNRSEGLVLSKCEARP